MDFVNFISLVMLTGSNGDAENARHETTAPKCRVENARNGNNGTMLQGVENARHEYSEKAEYRKPLIVNYR